MERVKAELMASESLASKPEEMREKIVEGQLKKHFAEQVLMSQAYILDDSKTVEQHVKEAIAKLGENIVVRQFKRIELGVSEEIGRSNTVDFYTFNIYHKHIDNITNTC